MVIIFHLSLGTMDISLVYFSPTNTTQVIVREIGNELQKALGGHIKERDITLLKYREKPIPVHPEDIVILGLPVYAGRIPFFLEPILHTLKADGNLAIIIAVYGNRHYDDALLEMKYLLHDQGFNVIAAGAFIGEHSFSNVLAANRPDCKDLEIARIFSKKIIEKITSHALTPIEVPGNFPHKERLDPVSRAPKTNEHCFDCMLCTLSCPVEAISLHNPRDIDETRCMSCFACVKKCPVDAKYFDHPMILNFKNMLEKTCLDRKEPSLYL